MARDFFDPTPEQQNVVLINAATLHEAQRLIESCEHCNPEGAEILFDAILDGVTGSDPSVTDYDLEQPAKYPNCRREILKRLSVCRKSSWRHFHTSRITALLSHTLSSLYEKRNQTLPNGRLWCNNVWSNPDNS